MDFIITPITVDGQPKCCDPITRRTDAILKDRAQEIGPDHWELFRTVAIGNPQINKQASDNSDPPTKGSVIFGICCATSIQLELTGQVEVRNAGYDLVRVFLNDSTTPEFEAGSTQSLGSDFAWDNEPSGPHDVTISLPQRPCGNIIRIEGTTKDGIANNDIWWRAKIISIS